VGVGARGRLTSARSNSSIEKSGAAKKKTSFTRSLWPLLLLFCRLLLLFRRLLLTYCAGLLTACLKRRSLQQRSSVLLRRALFDVQYSDKACQLRVMHVSSYHLSLCCCFFILVAVLFLTCCSALLNCCCCELLKAAYTSSLRPRTLVA
jgi:hypothetical protein